VPPAAAAPADLVVMGQVLLPYGVRGWIKVRPFTEAPATLLDHAAWWVDAGGRDGWKRYEMRTGRVHSDTLLAELAGVETREAALALKGRDIAVPRSALPAARAGEIYWADLVGLAVVNSEGTALGCVAGVTEHGAHPLLRVARPAGETGPERLIPYVPAHVVAVDLAGRRVDVDWSAEF
jgi:16S rRNA processing protein RimM